MEFNAVESSIEHIMLAVLKKSTQSAMKSQHFAARSIFFVSEMKNQIVFSENIFFIDLFLVIYKIKSLNIVPFRLTREIAGSVYFSAIFLYSNKI